MALKTLLVCLIDRDSADAVMACALPLARAHDAHLIGLHVLEAMVVYPGIAMHVPPDALAVFNANQHEEAAAIEAVFRKHTDAEDFVSEWRLVKGASTTAADRIIESARAADLVLMPNATAEHDQSHQVQASVIRESGRPVVVVPPGFSGDTVGTNAVIGWSETREATRAIHDYLQLADDAAEASILRVTGAATDELRDHAIVELAAEFDRHGIRTQASVSTRDGRDVAGVLMAHAFERGADLIVTGAFGHSRAYDFVIGSVTYGLLRDATIPVLFSA